MPILDSANYSPIIADGNYDVPNLPQGGTVAVKISGTFQTTVLEIQQWNPSSQAFEALDDADSTGIDGSGVTEFRIVMLAHTLRFVASATGTAPDIDVAVTVET